MAESGMTKEEYAQEWLSLAEMDLQSAEYLKGMRPMPLEIICFHSQQAVEKIFYPQREYAREYAKEVS